MSQPPSDVGLSEVSHASDVLVITTGGTIDAKPYPTGPGIKPPIPVICCNPSLIPGLIRSILGPDATNAHYKFDEWLHKDSNYLYERQLLKLADKIRKAEQKYVLVTHGTDAMPKNSRFLQKLLEGSGKVVLMVGAMQPFLHGDVSDAVPNLTYALKTLPTLEPGVHVVGRGVSKGPELFEPEEIVKNRRELVFERNRELALQQELQR